MRLIIVAGIALLASGLLATAVVNAPRAAPSASATSEVGRYVIVHSPEAERDTILLDTATGRTWTRVEVTDLADEPPAWDPMPQLNSVSDIKALEAVHGHKTTSSAKAPPGS